MLLGKYANEPFESDTETTWTINWLDDEDELLEIAWHPAGHEGAAAIDPQELLHWAAAVVASNAVVRRALKDIFVCPSIDFYFCRSGKAVMIDATTSDRRKN